MKSLTDPKYYHQLLGKRKSFILDPIFTAFEISTTEIGTKKKTQTKKLFDFNGRF